MISVRSPSMKGLSPPTRGNPMRAGAAIGAAGSIPAHAGEPKYRNGIAANVAVYPRPRGGTGGHGGPMSDERGLSPPTRGNLLNLFDDILFGRSIPAHAGEPRQ